MPNHDRFECQTLIDSDAILHVTGEGIRADSNGAQNGAESDMEGHVPATAESRPAEMYPVRKSDVLQRSEAGTQTAGTAGLP